MQAAQRWPREQAREKMKLKELSMVNTQPQRCGLVMSTGSLDEALAVCVWRRAQDVPVVAGISVYVYWPHQSCAGPTQRSHPCRNIDQSGKGNSTTPPAILPVRELPFAGDLRDTNFRNRDRNRDWNRKSCLGRANYRCDAEETDAPSSTGEITSQKSQPGGGKPVHCHHELHARYVPSL